MHVTSAGLSSVPAGVLAGICTMIASRASSTRDPAAEADEGTAAEAANAPVDLGAGGPGFASSGGGACRLRYSASFGFDRFRFHLLVALQQRASEQLCCVLVSVPIRLCRVLIGAAIPLAASVTIDIPPVVSSRWRFDSGEPAAPYAPRCGHRDVRDIPG